MVTPITRLGRTIFRNGVPIADARSADEAEWLLVNLRIAQGGGDLVALALAAMIGLALGFCAAGVWEVVCG